MTKLHPINSLQFNVDTLTLMLNSGQLPCGNRPYSNQFIEWILPKATRDKTQRSVLKGSFKALEKSGHEVLLSRLLSGELVYPDGQPLRLRTNDDPVEVGSILIENFLEATQVPAELL